MTKTTLTHWYHRLFTKYECSNSYTMAMSGLPDYIYPKTATSMGKHLNEILASDMHESLILYIIKP